MSAEGQSPLRVLAPASLVAFTIVLLIVVVASISGGDDDKSSNEPISTRTSKQSQSSTKRVRGATETSTSPSAKRYYVVKPGDNLAIIAEQTGVSLERLRELNQTLDPQGLVSGQRVKLPPPGD
jgi:LysM repeat protein